MKNKIFRFFKLLVYITLNAVLTAAFILLTYGLSLLLTHTVGERWPEIGDTIIQGVFLVVSVIGGIQFIAITAFNAYKTLTEELKNEDNGHEDNGHD